MNSVTVRVLLVEDSPSDADVLQETLRQAGGGRFEFTCVERLDAALARLREETFDVLLLDLNLPDSTEVETFRTARRAAPRLPIVVLTGLHNEDIGLQAVREGIQDYLTKGHADGGQIARSIRYAIERKRAEEAASLSQKTFAELIERSPFGTYVVDSQFRIAMMNASSQEGAFRNVRPVIGRDFAEAMRILWPEPVAAEIIGHFRHTLDTGEPYYSRDFINPRHDAEIVESYEWELHRMTLPDGQHGVICYYYDSTKLRQAEAAERASRAKLATAFASMTEAIFIADADGRLTDFNDEFVRYHRFKDRAECSRTIEDCPKYLDAYFADGTSAPPEQWAMARALRGETASSVEYRLRRKDTGETWWGSYNFAPIKDEDGGIIGAIVSTREITALKQAEEALAAAHRQTQSLIDNTTAMVYACDLEERFVLANAALAALLRTTPAQLLGKRRHEFMPQADADAHEAADRKVIAAGRAVEFEEHSDLHGRSITWLSTKFPLRDAQGRIYGVAGIVTDISERKRAEVALRESNQELEDFNQIMVGRELRMIEIKQEINALCAQLGQPPRYEFGDEEEQP